MHMKYTRAKRDVPTYQDALQPKKMDGLHYQPSKGYLPSENPKLNDGELKDQPQK
jgi:hypothetical protein